MTAQAESGRATQSNALPVELATQMSMITPATRTWPPGFDTTLDAVEQACPSLALSATTADRTRRTRSPARGERPGSVPDRPPGLVGFVPTAA